jgi:3-oxoacyl-[acyl-carrier protein] reductase
MATGIADLVDRIPVGRLGTPQDVADLICFLASAHAGFITGAVIDINGGFLIH